MKKVIKMYLHSSKDSNWDTARELGLSKKAEAEFMYALYEVELDVELDTETGKTKILSAKEV